MPTFTNRTTVFNLETLLTQKVRSEFIGRGKYQILPENTGVDAVLTGEVTAASLSPASFNAQQLATRYALTMTARIELRDVRENKVLWENPSLMFPFFALVQKSPRANEKGVLVLEYNYIFPAFARLLPGQRGRVV